MLSVWKWGATDKAMLCSVLRRELRGIFSLTSSRPQEERMEPPMRRDRQTERDRERNFDKILELFALRSLFYVGTAAGRSAVKIYKG